MLNASDGAAESAPAASIFAPGTYRTDPAPVLEALREAPAPVADVSPGERARHLCDLGRFGDALQAANEAIAADPRDLGAWCVLAEAHLGQDDAEAALRCAGGALEVEPSSERGHRLASEALAALGRDGEAAEAAAAAVRFAPDSWEAHARLAESLLANPDRLPAAREAAQRAIELAPGQAGPHLSLGAVAIAAGRPADAVSAYCAALGADPQCFEAHSRLSSLQHEVPRARPGLRWPRLGRGPRRAAD